MSDLSVFARLSQVSPQPAWKYLRSALILSTAALLGLIWLFTLNAIQRERENTLRSAASTQQHLAVMIAENLQLIIERGEVLARSTAGHFSTLPRHAGTQLSALRAGDRAYNRALLFDLNGAYLYGPTPATSTLPSDLVNAMVQDSERLRIIPRSPTHAQAWQLPILLPVRSTDGRLHALLQLDLDLGYLLQLYEHIDMGSSTTIRILTDGNTELATARRSGFEIPLVGAITEDAKDELSNHHQVGTLPLEVSVSRKLDDILDDFANTKRKLMLGMLLLSLMILAATVWATFLLRQQRHHFEHLHASETENIRLIGQLEEEKHRAIELAARDHLTGLLNRRMFIELGASHLAHARRQRHMCALLFIDLDRFKSINDTLGHNVGDRLLQTISERLRSNLREADVIARFGGDEFVVLLSAIETVAQIEVTVAKLLDVLSQPCPDLDGHTVQTTPSIGIALSPRDGNDMQALILHADAAMYRAKKTRRGSHAFYDTSLKSNNAAEFELEQRLLGAIEAGEFVLHFQPKVELKNFSIIGFEALVRWQHPQHGLIFPNDFIPMAEASGLILNLGEWILEAACRQLVEWRQHGQRPVPVAVNLSGRQLGDAQLANRILSMLERYSLPASLLQIEVTESSLVEHMDSAVAVLEKLATGGLHIALDDFGTGFSSLGYIRSLPIHSIKIDRSFVRDINNSHDDAVIVTSTIALAHNLGLEVIAEGIETRDQVVYLKTSGCDTGQGYHFSRPVAAAQAAALLTQSMEHPR